MNKTSIKNALKSKTFWATAGIIAGATFGAVGSNILGALQTIACSAQVCV